MDWITWKYVDYTFFSIFIIKEKKQERKNNADNRNYKKSYFL